MSGRPKDITGQRFGRLVAVRLMGERRNKRCVWECLCDCGRLHYPTAGVLADGKVKSCGCLQSEKAAEIGKIYAPINSQKLTKNLIGKRFGRLTVLEETEQRRNNKRVWKCLCDCGKVCYVSGEHLCRGNTRSCGCLGEETVLQNHEAFNENRQLIDGTAVTSISKMTLSSRNKTGVRGVFWDNRKQCYAASITFKRQRYYLGYFSDLEKAKEIRQLAEEKIFGEFLDWYYETYPEKKPPYVSESITQRCKLDRVSAG